MAGVKCPRCGLFNPESAEKCDCGYQFTAQPAGGARPSQWSQPANALPLQVSVVDVNMPFGSMVVFMVKWAIASIPAFLILIVLGAVVGVVFSGFLGTLVRLLGR